MGYKGLWIGGDIRAVPSKKDFDINPSFQQVWNMMGILIESDVV
jgi:hypothetical protein